ncbi:MAG: methyl-accepting chemotaxis protein [Myxococcales bacterium]|nr:methyl-accepting chemotaxis protein [Myxococcales bacterium]
MKWSVRAKLLITVLPLILITIAVLVYVSYYKASTSILDLQEKRTMLLVEKTMDDVEMWFGDRKGEINIFAKTGVFIDAIQGQRVEEARVRLVSYHKDAPHYENIFLADTNGTIVLDSIEGKSVGVKVAEIPAYKENIEKTKQGQVWLGNLAKSPATGRPVMLLTAPILSGQNLVGIIGTPIEIEFLSQRYIADFKVGDTGYFYICDSEGTFFAHPKKEMILDKNLKDFDFGPKILAKKDGMLEYKFGGKDRFAYFHTSKEKGWLFAASIERPEIMAPIKAMAALTAGLGLGALIFLSVMLAMMVTINVARPIRKTNDMLHDISEGEGDLTVRLDVVSNDEIGELAENFNRFVEKLQKSISLVAENTNVLQGAAGSLASVSTQLSSSAEELTGQSSTVASAAEEISVNVDTVSKATDRMSHNFLTIAASTEEMSSGVNSVAAAVEEMTATIREVSKNCVRASQISNDASSKADATGKIMGQLETAAKEIGKVVDVINDIADQTNLLALNATIEAASAGEAGKGFAVVANEVKELAKQTAQATDEIVVRVRGIQDQTINAVDAIKQIAETISEINSITNTIASAVEEQTVTTNEISRSLAGTAQGAGEVSKNIQTLKQSVESEVVRGVKEAATGVQEVSKNIQGVNTAAQYTANGAASTDQVAKQIQNLSEQLQTVVGQFKV